MWQEYILEFNLINFGSLKFISLSLFYKVISKQTRFVLKL